MGSLLFLILFFSVQVTFLHIRMLYKQEPTSFLESNAWSPLT